MKRNGREFSKVILAIVMLTYEIVTFFGIYIVTNDNSLLSDLFIFVGAPTSVAIGFYAWKAKAENILKISKYQDKDDPEKKEQIKFMNMLIEQIKKGMGDDNDD